MEREDLTVQQLLWCLSQTPESASSSREGDVKPVWLIRKMQDSALEHVLYSFVIPRGTKDFPILPEEPYV